jgi:hypothetical protein
MDKVQKGDWVSESYSFVKAQQRWNKISDATFEVFWDVTVHPLLKSGQSA